MSLPNRNIFINCPFDSDYAEMFRAICFATLACGFAPRCALERRGSGETRMEKIVGLIADCDLGIHDLSCTELGQETALPRFNMPFELGLFMGAKYFGKQRHKNKGLLILDRERFRYKTFISDISGHDIESHGREPARAVAEVRNWLRTEHKRPLPSAATIWADYQAFEAFLPQDAIFNDYVHQARLWLIRIIAFRQKQTPEPMVAVPALTQT